MEVGQGNRGIDPLFLNFSFDRKVHVLLRPNQSQVQKAKAGKLLT